MRIEIGDRVKTIDGKDAGTIDKLILSPVTRDVKLAVIRKGAIFPHDVEVPLDMLERKDNGDVVLKRTASQLGDLPTFHEAEYVPWPTTYPGPWGYPSAALVWPASYPYPEVPYLADDPLRGEVDREVEAAHQREDLENAVVDAGSDVLSSDGKKIGELERLIVDTTTGKPTGVVVRQGFVFTRDVTLPGETIAGFDDGKVYLRIPSEQVGAYQ